MTGPRLPTIKEREEIVKAETLYKVAHVEDEKPHFNFSSCFMGHPCEFGPSSYQQLKYVVGKVTTAPSGSNGIWCYSLGRLELAQRHATGELGITIQPPCVVLEVKPLGEFYHQDKPMSVYVVGVYGKKEEYVNPFKVGDRVKVKESVGKAKYGWCSVTHKDIGVIKEACGDRLEVLFPTFCQGNYPWSAHAPEMELVPEPKEEWVDITEEITCKISTADHIVLSHAGTKIGVVGLLPLAQFTPSTGDYKVKPAGAGFSPRIQYAQILKKELK